MSNPSATSIQHLMPELLNEVFTHCLPSDFSKPISRVAPFNISTVCKLWRNLVLKRPSLWSSLELVIHHEGCNLHVCTDPVHAICRRTSRAWERWLELSQASLLDITLDLSTSQDLTDDMSGLILKSFDFDVQRRWRRFSMECRLPLRKSILREISRINIHRHLVNLNVKVANRPFYNYKINVLDFRDASSLSSLSIQFPRTTLSRTPEVIVPSMGALTKLEVRDMGASELFDLFSKAPNLAYVKVGLYGEVQKSSGVTLGQLRYFHFNMFRSADVASLSSFLDLLSAPWLQGFVLRCVSPNRLTELSPWAALKSFLWRSNQANIHVLALHCHDVQELEALFTLPTAVPEDINLSRDETLISILEELPNLKRLRVVGALATDRLRNALARDRKQGILCPMLRDVAVVTQEQVGNRIEMYQDKNVVDDVEERFLAVKNSHFTILG